MNARMNLFEELNRRNVLRAGILYAGAVWALSQGIAQLSPALGLPDWATRWFLIAAAIGFPFWIAFAWFYEFTPQVLRRESEVAADASITRSTGRKLDRAIHRGAGDRGGAAADQHFRMEEGSGFAGRNGFHDPGQVHRGAAIRQHERRREKCRIDEIDRSNQSTTMIRSPA